MALNCPRTNNMAYLGQEVMFGTRFVGEKDARYTIIVKCVVGYILKPEDAIIYFRKYSTDFYILKPENDIMYNYAIR